MHRYVVTVLAIAAVAVGFSGQTSAAARIDSVSPTAAGRGAAVELRGGGFGAKNVSVWVGGVSAQVLSATGNRVRFLVPGTAPLGSTKIEAANPGGQRASIAFTVLFDGTVQPVPDAASATSAAIGREGGTISTQGLTLTIPAGALSETTEITVTPLLDLNGTPLQGQVLGALFAPDGLALLKPAILSFAAPAGTTLAEILAFEYAGNGQDFHLVPHEFSDGVVELEIWHFSGAGGHFGNFVNGVPTWTPGTAETQAEQKIAVAKHDCELQELANPGGNNPACDALPGAVRQALFDWYVAAVKPGLQSAVDAPSFQVEEAFAEWLRWGGRALILVELGAIGSLQQQLDEGEELATKALADLTTRRLNNCTGTDVASQLRDVVRMADLAVAGAIDLTTEELPSAFNADLMRACASIRIDPPSFPTVAARVHANQLTLRVYIATFTGAQITTEPLDLSLTTTNGDSDVNGGSLDASGGFQTNVYPFDAATGVIVDVTVALAANALAELTDPTVRESLASSERVIRVARDRIELGPLPGVSTTVNAGTSAPLKVRIAGNGMENATVGYSVSGVGSLSSLSGITNQDGEAPTFDYIAPSNPSGVTATGTATLGSDQESVTFTIQNVAVAISPTSTSLALGQTQQFSATVTGTPNTAVTWSATGGAISSGGLYTAGSNTGSFSVTATSVADPTRTASALVTIGSGGVVTVLLGEWRGLADFTHFSGEVRRGHLYLQICRRELPDPVENLIIEVAEDLPTGLSFIGFLVGHFDSGNLRGQHPEGFQHIDAALVIDPATRRLVGQFRSLPGEFEPNPDSTSHADMDVRIVSSRQACRQF